MIPLEDLETLFKEVRNHICTQLATQESRPYHEDRWQYDKGDGGGITRVWEGGTLLEKGGVNYSSIRGASLPQAAATAFNIPQGTPYAAMGVSLVIHPWNPHIPTTHMNIRHFRAGDLWWFGGGIDLTPYYPVKEEVIRFHTQLKEVCDTHDEPYAKHKATCDDYFTIIHRNEMRGVGGIFFDHLNTDMVKNAAFVRALGMAFPDTYLPFIRDHRDDRHTDAQLQFQRIRRGRYAEFNLVYDRGTKFGLQSGGRIQSILMSMPPKAIWNYNDAPTPGSPEHEITTTYYQPQDWVAMK